jgi:hypothetical protein
MVLVIEIQGAAGQDIDERTRELGFWSEIGLGSARAYQAAIPTALINMPLRQDSGFTSYGDHAIMRSCRLPIRQV